MNRSIGYLLLSAFFIFNISFSQEKEDVFGIGASYGPAFPKVDIKESKDHPLGRVFVQYFPAENVGLEAGIGMGLLEAEKDGLFFTSTIYPIDLRLILQPMKTGKFQPYAFGGVGLLVFDPKDQADQPLLRNSRGEYGHTASYVPLGLGGKYHYNDQVGFGVSLGYNAAFSDNLDDIKAGGNDSYWSFAINIFAFIKAGNNDLDGDGCLNDDERRLGTDPLNPDTDGDGLKDCEEVNTLKTNPLSADTDGDGCSDGDEVLKYRTDPLRADTDGEGLNDCDELLTHRTDPLKPDTDGDGCTDAEEVLTHRTDPLRQDTDGEGLNDCDEIRTHKTDPLKPDTDDDGCSDADEVLKHKTNPLQVDTDQGGMPDCKEVQLGLNPLEPSDDVPIIKVGERIILEGVNFETAKTTLLPGARAILDQVASSLSAYPTAEVAIHGHTDNVGGAKYNMNLSNGRAESVKKYLVSKGISAARITTRGYGFTKPVADNSTAEGKAKNRRIEFVRVK